MANQETAVSNSYESTLSASLGAGDTTINVTTTDGTPGVPFFVVIDPADDSKREVVLVDSCKTGTTLTLSSAAQRGQDGTTDVAHDANAVIGIYPIAALWTDINDRVDSHAHSGGSDGAAVATGSLTGHDKLAHDALLIDADTVDGSHAVDFVADVDHTKVAHDALNIDADTVDGIDGATTIQSAIDDINAVVSADADTVSTGETTTSTIYADLTTVGPSVTITTGTFALVWISAQVFNDTTGSLCFVGVEVSGATTLAADNTNAIQFESDPASQRMQAGIMIPVTLTAGSNTFTLKYKVNAGTGQFGNRHIAVLPIGD